jgi:hypothetical protein
MLRFGLRAVLIYRSTFRSVLAQILAWRAPLAPCDAVYVLVPRRFARMQSAWSFLCARMVADAPVESGAEANEILAAYRVAAVPADALVAVATDASLQTTGCFAWTAS